jgi:hypothetical protein
MSPADGRLLLRTAAGPTDRVRDRSGNRVSREEGSSTLAWRYEYCGLLSGSIFLVAER